MTFEELVKKVALSNGVPNSKASTIIREALAIARDAALKGAGAPMFPEIGRFVAVAVRSMGRRPDGSKWEKPGRVKLGLSPSKYSGAPCTERKPPQSVVAA